MKKLVLSMFAVAALASCVQNETINPGSAIDFGAPFVGNATKAADPSYGAAPAQQLTEFKVYGTVQGTGAGVVNIFNGADVTGSIGNDVWRCDVKQYWIEGATYNFAAVVDADVTPGDNNMPKTLSPQKDNGFYKDMLYAFDGPITAAAENGPVNFAFEHLLAKAQFVVTSNTVDGYYYNVEEIKIQNIHTGAVYTIGTKVSGKDNGTWNDGTLSENVADWYSLGDIKNITKANTLNKAEGDKFMTNATQVLLIPTTTEFKVSFIVKLYHNNGTTANTADDVLLRTIDCTGVNAKAVDTDLVKGYAYNFNLNLTTGTEIKFTVTSQPTWASGADSNLSL